MRHLKHTFKIGRTAAHRHALIANAVCSLFQHGKIETTLVKAKEIRRFADRMITLAKEGSLSSMHHADSIMRNRDTVSYLFKELGPKYAERKGGYTRIVKLGPRRGDAAEMCLLSLVETDDVVKERKAAAEKAAAQPTEAPKAEEAPAQN